MVAKEWALSSSSPVSEQKAAGGPRGGGILTHKAPVKGRMQQAPRSAFREGLAHPSPSK